MKIAVVAAALFTFAALLPPGPAIAKKAKVWKYETRDGKIDFGTHIPDGAVALEEVGEVEVPDAEATATPPPAPASSERAVPALPHLTDLERVLESLAERPATFGGMVAAVFLWAVVLLRIFSAAFRTLEMNWERAIRLVLTILLGIALLALLGQGLEWIWTAIGWTPRSEFGEATMAAVGWAIYALVPVLVFRKRLGVGLTQAALLATLWFAFVFGAAALLWFYLDAAMAVSGKA